MRRQKGSGSIQEKNGRFYFRVKIDGKEKTTTLKAKTLKEAEREAGTIQAPLDVTNMAEIALFVGRQKKIITETFSPLMSEVFDIYEKSPVRPSCQQKQIEIYRSYWKLFTSSLPQSVTRLHLLTSEMCESFFANLQKNPRTWNGMLKACRMIYRIAAPEAINPFQRIKIKREEIQDKIWLYTI